MATFDKNSGVVYTETTSAQVGSMVPTWMFRARNKNYTKSNLRNRGKGCSSLQQMALRACAFNAERFEPATLQWAGWHYAGQIYHDLIHNQSLTFEAWNIFLDAYPEEINAQQEFLIYEGGEAKEPIQLFSITSRLAKLNMSLVTMLCVRNFSLTFDHLKGLISIPTLAALILEHSPGVGETEITARHFLDFGRAVKEKGALQKLRLMVLRDFGISKKDILRAIASFPAIQLVGLQNPRADSMDHTQQHASDEWKPMTSELLEKRGFTSQQMHPQSIWNNRCSTIFSTMQQLYDLATFLTIPAPLSEYRSVSITYAGPTNSSGLRTAMWLIRDPTAQKQKPKASEPVDSAVTKKRKMRESKKRDLGDFLGAFG